MRPSIGSTVWVFDIDRRVYSSARSGPIYREHFVAHRIVEETPRSWVLDNGMKFNKATKESARDNRGYKKRLFDETQVNDACFVNDHRAELSRAVLMCDDAETLRRIAAVLAGDGKPPTRFSR